MFYKSLRGFNIIGKNSIKKTKEHSKQFRENTVEKVKGGYGYNLVSQALKISQSTHQSIIPKLKELDTPKLTGWTSRAFIGKAQRGP